MKVTSPRGGIVREAKRPPGWTPPGPEPVGPQGREELWPAEGEDLCFLTGHWRIFQRVKGHRYSLDDLMTAWSAAEEVRDRQVRRAVDIGCGIGSVLMMVAWRLPDAEMIGVEAQTLSFGLAGRSILYNGIESRVEVRHGDLREPEMVPEGPVFDLVTGTPPYIPIGDGVMSEKEQCAPCRFELRGGIEDYCATAARLLAPAGRFVVCHSGVSRTLEAGAAAGLVTLRHRAIIPREGRAPLFSIFVMARADDPEAALVGDAPQEVDPFMVRDAQGQRTSEYLQVRKDMGMPC